MPMFSIVIPVFNQIQELLLTMCSIQLQDFSKKKVEVIIVDDQSTEDIQLAIKNLNYSLDYKYIRTREKKGRGAARNLGAANANGEYIIFLDADYLVKRTFLSTLYEKISSDGNENKIISDFPYSGKCVFANWHPDFDINQIERLKNSKYWSDELLKVNQVVSLFTIEDLINGNFDKLEELSFWEGLPDEGLIEAGKTDVAPWTTFVTRCVALKRNTFESVHGFDENFVKYGLEDWELGYRLHKNGMEFETVKENLGYHQEHPNHHRGEDKNDENLKYFLGKHGTTDIEVGLLLASPPWPQWIYGLMTYKKLIRILKQANQTEGLKDLIDSFNNTITDRVQSFLAE